MLHWNLDDVRQIIHIYKKQHHAVCYYHTSHTSLLQFLINSYDRVDGQSLR